MSECVSSCMMTDASAAAARSSFSSSLVAWGRSDVDDLHRLREFIEELESGPEVRRRLVCDAHAGHVATSLRTMRAGSTRLASGASTFNNVSLSRANFRGDSKSTPVDETFSMRTIRPDGVVIVQRADVTTRGNFRAVGQDCNPSNLVEKHSTCCDDALHWNRVRQTFLKL